jgi:uncharacterized zinc-type alcohol dehydrogenase-like protein
MEWIYVSSSTGHEIGRVVEVGNAVTTHKVGDLVGRLYGRLKPVPCKQDLENFAKRATFTYNSPDKHLEGKQTYGGYSTSVVVDEKFVLRIPENLDEAQLHRYCVQELLHGHRHWNVKKGDKVGVVGLGGLGHRVLNLLMH